MEAKAARIRVGGGWLIAPQVPGLKDGVNENEALELLAEANTAGCLGRDGDVEYLGRPGSAPRPSSPTSPKPPTSPRGRPKSSQRPGVQVGSEGSIWRLSRPGMG